MGFVGQSLAFGLWLSVLVASLIVAHLIYRTQLEESLLNKGLPGYKEYAEKVRFRWLPGVW